MAVKQPKAEVMEKGIMEVSLHLTCCCRGPGAHVYMPAVYSIRLTLHVVTDSAPCCLQAIHEKCGQEGILMSAIRISTADLGSSEQCRLLLSIRDDGKPSFQNGNMSGSTHKRNTWSTSQHWTTEEMTEAFRSEDRTSILRKDPDDSIVYYIVLTKEGRQVRDGWINDEVKQLVEQITTDSPVANGEKHMLHASPKTKIEKDFKDQMFDKLLPYFVRGCEFHDGSVSVPVEINPGNVGKDKLKNSAMVFVAYGSGCADYLSP